MWENVQNFVQTELFAIGGTPVTVMSVIVFILVVLVSAVVSRFVQIAIRRTLLHRDPELDGTAALVCRLTHYAIMIIGLAIGMQTIGIQLSALFAAGAVVAVGVGFALQNISQNFVSGLILLVERAIKPGDVLEVDGQIVRVEDMGIRATVVRNLYDEHVLVPNSSLVESNVKNFTYKGSLRRIHARVGVAYESNLSKTFEVLQQAGEGFDDRLKSRTPVVLLLEFGSSSVNFEVSIWTSDPWRSVVLKSKLMLAVWDALAAADIVIAFPQLDVHLDAEVVQRLGGALAEAGDSTTAEPTPDVPGASTRSQWIGRTPVARA